MTFNWKIPAVSAGGAFLLSLLVGLIGRVGFGTVIGRGLLWAVIFGALAFGLNYLLRRFLPELFANRGEGAEENERAVDITLDEENPLAGRSAGVSESDVHDGSPDDQKDGEERIPADEDLFGEDSTEVSELEQADEREEISGASGEESGDSSGELPGLETVETAFVASGVEERNDRRSTVSIDALGLDEDPAIVAKALRTFMNKDREG